MINFFHTVNHKAGKELASSGKIMENLIINQEEINIMDGGEFLDDGIRMKEQPFIDKVVAEEN